MKSVLVGLARRQSFDGHVIEGHVVGVMFFELSGSDFSPSALHIKRLDSHRMTFVNKFKNKVYLWGNRIIVEWVAKSHFDQKPTCHGNNASPRFQSDFRPSRLRFAILHC